ncbi:hypothetical protein [Streptomyces tubercidicus]|uniref:hypothetical protein n=1 Tax=Streptomyces tubercidicus TaxID=47759 RepID=UPI0022B79090|nr:hypothetical protein [Streptomyces tubercidicus]WAU10859.1 hypothetical protein STRTU_000988 [Streptomyces tubercidicus]
MEDYQNDRDVSESDGGLYALAANATGTCATRKAQWEEYLAPSTDPDRKTVLWSLIRRHDPNPDSLVLALVYKQRVMVFMGDATKETEDFILGTWGAPGFPAADLTLKMGHQSSDTSSTERWIKLLKPKRLTISSGTKSFNGSG